MCIRDSAGGVLLNQPRAEYVSGYAEIDMPVGTPNENTIYNGFGVEPSSLTTIDGVQCYTKGFVTVSNYKITNKTNSNRYYHPFALASWMYMRINKPSMIYDNIDPEMDLGNDIAATIVRISNMVNSTFKLSLIHI